MVKTVYQECVLGIDVDIDDTILILMMLVMMIVMSIHTQ